MLRVINSTLLKNKFSIVSRMFSSFDIISGLKSRIEISDEIQHALKTNIPIVALESTIITHGMPYPINLETALEVENIVRNENVIPATIGILNGRIKVGLSTKEIEILANESNKTKTLKTSRRDFPIVLSNNLNGGTTVAGTLIVANLVGIKVFATGGIGGVHRDGHITMDVSADLIELGRTPIAVVSSGVKSILDIPRTLEYLETQGVLVGVYQNSNCDFPAFYTRSSGVKAPYNFESPLNVAKSIDVLIDLNLKSGILVAVPIPKKYAMDELQMSSAIETAIKNAKKEGVRGKEMTPYLLSAISKITDGRSLDANIALIKNNAKIASQISFELSVLKSPKSQNTSTENWPVVFGGSILDTCITVLDDNIKMDGATYNSKIQNSGGGVGRNISDVLFKLYGKCKLISAVGNDQNGNYLRATLPRECAENIIIKETIETANCSVILDKFGDCKLVVGNMEIHKSINSELITKNEDIIRNAPIIVMDANLPLDSMKTLLEICQKYEKPVFFEPTDLRLADKPFSLDTDLLKTIKFISPNIYEIRTMASKLGYFSKKAELPLECLTKDEVLKEVREMSEVLIKYIDNIIVTLGNLGIVIVRNNNEKTFFNPEVNYISTKKSENVFRFYPANKVNDIVNVSGAGDSFISGFISSMLSGKTEAISVSVGFEAAEKALKSTSCVPLNYFDKNHCCWKTEAKFEEF